MIFVPLPRQLRGGFILRVQRRSILVPLPRQFRRRLVLRVQRRPIFVPLPRQLRGGLVLRVQRRSILVPLPRQLSGSFYLFVKRILIGLHIVIQPARLTDRVQHGRGRHRCFQPLQGSIPEILQFVVHAGHISLEAQFHLKIGLAQFFADAQSIPDPFLCLRIEGRHIQIDQQRPEDYEGKGNAEGHDPLVIHDRMDIMLSDKDIVKVHVQVRDRQRIHSVRQFWRTEKAPEHVVRFEYLRTEGTFQRVPKPQHSLTESVRVATHPGQQVPKGIFGVVWKIHRAVVVDPTGCDHYRSVWPECSDEGIMAMQHVL